MEYDGSLDGKLVNEAEVISLLSIDQEGRVGLELKNPENTLLFLISVRYTDLMHIGKIHIMSDGEKIWRANYHFEVADSIINPTGEEKLLHWTMPKDYPEIIELDDDSREIIMNSISEFTERYDSFT